MLVQLSPQSYFTNSEQGINFKKLGCFVNDDTLIFFNGLTFLNFHPAPIFGAIEHMVLFHQLFARPKLLKSGLFCE